MSTWASLVRKADNSVIGALIDIEATKSIRHPDDAARKLCSPPEIGWEDSDFALVAATPADPAPEGQHIASTSRAIVGGQVVETATYEDDPPAPVPSEVSRRQFKMQLAIAGLSSTVEAWVATQDALVQIAYAESGAFRRDEPMMQAGFDALGLTTEQVDAFFAAAATL